MKWIFAPLILFSVLLWAQPTQREVSDQIVWDPVSLELFTTAGENYPVCKIERLSMIDNVVGPFTSGQCLQRNASDQWVGGACGTGGDVSSGLRSVIDGAVQIDSVELNDTSLDMASDGGTAKSIDFSGLRSRDTADEIRDKLAALQGTSRLDAGAIKNLPSGGSGGSVSLGESQVAVFQIPVLASTTLTVTTAGTPVFHNIGSFTGTGITGQLTQSTVSGVARVTVGQAGYVNLVWEDELQIISSNAGTQSDGELIFAITQYDSTGSDLRSWVYEHAITDPIVSGNGFKFPFSLVTGLTPVSVGDYFTLNFAWNINQNNKNIVFALPTDNPGLDERVEFIFFHQTTIGTGPTGPAGTCRTCRTKGTAWRKR